MAEGIMRRHPGTAPKVAYQMAKRKKEAASRWSLWNEDQNWRLFR